MHIKADKGERIGSDAPAFSAFILAAWPAALQRLRDALLWMFPHGAGPTGPLDFTQMAEMNLGNFKVSLCETLVRRICGGMTMPQNNPVIFPSLSTSIFSAAGTLGRPGMVMIAPVRATTNPAPAFT